MIQVYGPSRNLNQIKKNLEPPEFETGEGGIAMSTRIEAQAPTVLRGFCFDVRLQHTVL